MQRKNQLCWFARALPIGLALTIIGCSQQDIVFPDPDLSTRACGPWYAGGAEMDNEVVYGIEEGDTLPCVVWTSVMRDGDLTRLNLGELYLDVQAGLDHRKALVVMISGQPCPACAHLIEGLQEYRSELNDLAVVVALNKGEPALDIEYNIYEVENILITQEGWPTEWPITNDTEDYYTGFESFPWIQVVRLRDMRVVELGNGRYSGANIDELVATIEAFD